MPVMKKTWRLSFYIHPLGISGSTSFTSILRLTTNEKNGQTPGARIVAFFFESGSLQLYTSAEIQGDNHPLCTPTLEIGKLAFVEMKQELIDGNYVLTQSFNGQNCTEVINPSPEEFQNVKVYLSDKHYDEAIATVIEYKFENLDNNK